MTTKTAKFDKIPFQTDNKTIHCSIHISAVAEPVTIDTDACTCNIRRKELILPAGAQFTHQLLTDLGDFIFLLFLQVRRVHGCQVS